MTSRWIIFSLIAAAIWGQSLQAQTEKPAPEDVRRMFITGKAAIEDGFVDTAEASLQNFLKNTKDINALERDRADAAQLYLRALALQDKFDALLEVLDKSPE